MRKLNVLEATNFQRPCRGTVKVSGDAREQMLSFKQLSPKSNEAGGVLIGRHILNSNDIVVDRVTVPQAGDRRKRTSFFRSERAHQAILDVEWTRSAGTSVYLGEWHTHPERIPRPSSVDMSDWYKRLRLDSVEANFLLFAIVGQAELRFWEGQRDRLGVTMLLGQDARIGS